MSFTQLNPTIPVTVVGKGRGFALAVIDYSQEHDLLWVTAMTDTGEIWCVPNQQIRIVENWSLGRDKNEKLE